MRKIHCKTAAVAGLMAGALALTTAGRAGAADLVFAGVHNTYKFDQFGNGDLGADYYWSGEEDVSSDNWTAASPDTNYHRAVGTVRDCGVQEAFITDVYLFGNVINPLVVQPEAFTTAAPDQWAAQSGNRALNASAWSQTSILGNVVYSAGASTCTSPSGHAKYCTSFDQRIMKTLFSASKTFSVGPIPITVQASVIGVLHGGQSTLADVTRYVGIADSSYETLSANITGEVYATASLGASAGIPGVVGVGVDANFKLIDISVTPSSYQHGDSYTLGAILGPPGGAPASGSGGASGFGGTWYNKLPINLNTMSGSVDVWGQIVLKYTKTIVSWNGYSTNTTLVDDTANYKTGDSGF